jgi:hypothetical protein
LVLYGLFFSDIGVDAVGHRILALCLGKSSILFCDHSILLLSGNFGLVCSLPVVKLSALNALCFELVTELLLLVALGLKRFQHVRFATELMRKLSFLLLGSQDLNISLSSDLLKLFRGKFLRRAIRNENR